MENYMIVKKLSKSTTRDSLLAIFPDELSRKVSRVWIYGDATRLAVVHAANARNFVDKSFTSKDGDQV
jgi:hypothetical protein